MLIGKKAKYNYKEKIPNERNESECPFMQQNLSHTVRNMHKHRSQVSGEYTQRTGLVTIMIKLRVSDTMTNVQDAAKASPSQHTGQEHEEATPGAQDEGKTGKASPLRLRVPLSESRSGRNEAGMGK